MGSTGAVGGADAEQQRHTKMAGQAGHNMGRMLEQAGNGCRAATLRAQGQDLQGWRKHGKWQDVVCKTCWVVAGCISNFQKGKSQVMTGIRGKQCECGMHYPEMGKVQQMRGNAGNKIAKCTEMLMGDNKLGDNKHGKLLTNFAKCRHECKMCHGAQQAR